MHKKVVGSRYSASYLDSVSTKPLAASCVWYDDLCKKKCFQDLDLVTCLEVQLSNNGYTACLLQK